MLMFTAASILPDVNAYFELVQEWPNEQYRLTLCAVIVLDFVGAYICETVSGKVFPPSEKP